MDKQYMDNYLHGTDIWIYQRRDMFRVNTDTFLLGTYLRATKSDRILDIGTNNGALLLYASKHHLSTLVGVDVQQEALELAKVNLDRNQVSNYELYHTPIQQFLSEPFDVIVSNPPYFPKSENMNENEYMRIARHEQYLTFDELCLSVKRLLKPDGHWQMVHRPNRYDELKTILYAHGFFIQHVKWVYDKRKVEPVSVLMTMVLTPCETLEESMMLD